MVVGLMGCAAATKQGVKTTRPGSDIAVNGSLIGAKERVLVKLEPATCGFFEVSRDGALERRQRPYKCWTPEDDLLSVVWSEEDGSFVFDSLYKAGSDQRFPIRSGCPYRVTVYAAGRLASTRPWDPEDRIPSSVLCSVDGSTPVELNISRWRRRAVAGELLFPFAVGEKEE